MEVEVKVVVEVVMMVVVREEEDTSLEMEEAESSQYLAPKFASLPISVIHAENLRKNNVFTLESPQRCRAGPETTSDFKSMHVLQQ